MEYQKIQLNYTYTNAKEREREREIFRLHILMEVNVDPGTYYPWVHGFVYYTPISTKKHLYRWC